MSLLDVNLPAILGQSSGHLTVDAVLSPYVVVFVVAFLTSFLMTPLMRWVAVCNGIVDQPDFERKIHLEPIAYLGGVAVFIGWLTGIAASFFITPHQPPGPASAVADGMAPISASVVSDIYFPLSIVIGAAVITLTGLIDDVHGLSPRVKVGGQFFAAAALALQDVGLKLVAFAFAGLGMGVPEPIAYFLGAVLIAVFVVGGCNAMNLLDGLDGLAAGVGVIAMAGFLFIAVWFAVTEGDPAVGIPGVDRSADPVRIVMCMASLGALLGFLPYNFSPANIFMGDAGSLLTGYLCVATILLFAHAAGRGPLLVMGALVVFALPITDTLMAIIRRKLLGKPILSPDREHIHHQMFRAVSSLRFSPGWTVKLAVLILYALAGFFAVLGCAMLILDRWRYVLTAFMVIFLSILVLAYKAGHNRVLLAEEGQRKRDRIDQEAQRSG